VFESLITKVSSKIPNLTEVGVRGGPNPVLGDKMVSSVVESHSNKKKPSSFQPCSPPMSPGRVQSGARSEPWTDGMSKGTTVASRVVGQFRDTMSTTEEMKHERWRVSEIRHCCQGGT